MADFFRAMTPVLFANLLTLAFVYACWLASKTETREKEKYLFVSSCGLIALVLGLTLFGIHLYGR
jgi:hypothetical protein